MGKKVGYAIIIAFVLLVVAVVIYGLGWYIPLEPPTNGPTDGPEPTVIYKTTVYVTNPWIGGAYIDKVVTEYIGEKSTTAYSTKQPRLTIFPFKGKVTLEIVYPKGKMLIGEQRISVDKGCTRGRIQLQFLRGDGYGGLG